MVSRIVRRWTTWLLLVVVLGLSSCWKSDDNADKQRDKAKGTDAQVVPETVVEPLTLELVELNNRGVGLMGQFDYEKAHPVFAELCDKAPRNADFQVNLAIATFNRRQGNDTQDAESRLKRIVKSDPKNWRAHYCLGILLAEAAENEAALREFQAVAAADPSDAYAAYFCGKCFFEDGEFQKALDMYRRALRLDPYLRSAYYGCYQAMQRLGQGDAGAPLLKDFQDLEHNPQARTADIKYTRMGPKAAVASIDLAKPEPPEKLSGAVFAAAEPLVADLPQPAEGGAVNWAHFGGDDRPPNITVCDINGDGRMDLFLASALEVGDARRNAILIRTDRGFELALDHPLAAVTDVNAVLWGNYDNRAPDNADDKAVAAGKNAAAAPAKDDPDAAGAADTPANAPQLTDAYFCRRGGNQLWRQTEPGRWEDVTESTGASGGDHDTIDGAMVDADHDGDLDFLLVNADAPNELLNNNLDGTFTPIAADRGIAGNGRPSIGLLVADLDSDRDADLLILHDHPPHEAWLNDRLWTYHPAKGWDELLNAPIKAIVAADADADGQLELYTLADDGVVRWTWDEKKAWQPKRIVRGTGKLGGKAQLAVADVDGDGTLDLLYSTAAGWSCVALRDDYPVLFEAKTPGLASWALAVLDPGRGPAVIGVFAEGRPKIWRPGPARHAFIDVALSGKRDDNNSLRSNLSGIGAKLSMRVGSRWTSVTTYRNSSGPGQSLQPAALGLGDAKTADFVTIDWPDGVMQTETDLVAGPLRRIPETQRQTSSCPVLFAWDGEKYAFVTDLLGVGGLGFAVAPGVYAPVTPRENVLLPGGCLRPRDGRLQLKLTEPMEEICYLDSVGLAAYDLPPGWRMTLDERMAVQGPPTTGEPRFYRDEVLPTRAMNDRGQDVTAAIAKADLVAAPPGAADRRFIGRAAEHGITLSFDRPLDGHAGTPLLLADGWIEYPYSQTMFAAWQAKAEYQAPTLEACDAEGQWHAILPQFGYPAGMPRQMSLPLAGLPEGCRQLRVRTTQEIYWDRLAVVWAEPCPSARRSVLALSAARLQYIGFPRRSDGPQRQPSYDYARRSDLWDTRYPRGFYTEYGPVDELIAATDDAVAIFGPGEEVHLEFAAPIAEPAAGWTRQFVLETAGWTKDMDLYTRDGETVEPLPCRESSTAEQLEARDRLHAQFNTRYQAGQ